VETLSGSLRAGKYHYGTEQEIRIRVTNLDVVIQMDHDSTIPSTLMPDDFADSAKQKSPNGHPILKILLAAGAFLAFWMLLKLLKQ
jgi:hypothetical protein